MQVLGFVPIKDSVEIAHNNIKPSSHQKIKPGNSNNHIGFPVISIQTLKLYKFFHIVIAFSLYYIV
jgi:hypothetical protein